MQAAFVGRRIMNAYWNFCIFIKGDSARVSQRGVSVHPYIDEILGRYSKYGLLLINWEDGRETEELL